MKKLCILSLILTGLWLLTAGAVLSQQRLSAQVIRLHVLAASDSAADQAEKLRVRDAVLAQASALTAGCRTRQEAAAALAAGTRQLAETAADTAGRPASAALSRERYETRRYGGFSLPAGPYLSLRVSLGEGAGHNWWCVAFPSVCTISDGWQTVAADGGLSDGDIALMEDERPQIHVRYFILEQLNRLAGKLWG